MDELLNLLKHNALETPENLAKMLDLPVEEVKSRIKDYEKRGIIRGYQTVVDEDMLDLNRVTAVIEVKIVPEREGGLNNIAMRISRFPEVQSAYLMSGTFDLLLFVAGKDLKEVASFVSEKLAPIEAVTSTATHFMLKTYRYHGIVMEKKEEYERLKITP